jgi:hypothetical protein
VKGFDAFANGIGARYHLFLILSTGYPVHGG